MGYISRSGLISTGVIAGTFLLLTQSGHHLVSGLTLPMHRWELLRSGVPSLGGAMRRRYFIAVAGPTVVWPLFARAQQSTMPVIGYIGTGSPETDAFRLPSFH